MLCLSVLTSRLVKQSNSISVRTERYSTIDPSLNLRGLRLPLPAQNVQGAPILRLDNRPVNSII